MGDGKALGLDNFSKSFIALIPRKLGVAKVKDYRNNSLVSRICR